METRNDDPINFIPGREVGDNPGLTKREYFAVMAMQAYITSSPQDSALHAAFIAVRLADGLIKELNK